MNYVLDYFFLVSLPRTQPSVAVVCIYNLQGKGSTLQLYTRFTAACNLSCFILMKEHVKPPFQIIYSVNSISQIFLPPRNSIASSL